ncbi:unnamed protein product [Angiostrongylus costaricensis]|uniref:Na_H_Exchanger domain-containing protein n=1 Tax=Angiostrongylus costaricensis TaxID=334426 RepID=A0A0R3PY61_ANGCS|nr:unnamed protein product [Angiostrongylus costaricensis]
MLLIDHGIVFAFPVFHRSNVLAKIFPESALLIVLGLIVGLILDELWVLDIYLHPVAVLSVFEEIHVNQLLYICVFGESLLNDAVTIVLYHSLSSMAKIGGENLIREDFLHAFINFVMVSTGGILIGLVWVCVTAFATKWSYDVPIVQPLVCLFFPYLSYLIAESVHMSGILACEAIIFVFLGLSTFSKNHTWDLTFALVTVTACICCRFIGVMILTWIANEKRVQKIGLMDQVIMGYGGLRGAICYGLVMTLDKDAIPAKDMLVSTTVVVIVITVFFQSGDDMMAGVEAIIGMRGSNYVSLLCSEIFLAHKLTSSSQLTFQWRRRLSEFNHNYVQPTLMRTPTSRGEKLMEKYSALSAEEQRLRLLERFGV